MTNHIIEQVEEVDRIWFEQHPRCRWRVRTAFVGEHPPPDEFWRGIWNWRYTPVYRSRSTGANAAMAALFQHVLSRRKQRA